MKFSEIMELAKAGYKPSEILELRNLEKDADPETPVEQEEPNAEDTTESNEVTEDNPTQEQQEDSTDYKALYEKAVADLKAAQQANVNIDTSGSKPDENEELAKLVKDFM